MTQFSNTNRGSIWKNEKKLTDTHPDFTGALNVEGVEYWVSAWKRKPDASPNAPALSFSIKLKEPRPVVQQEAADASGFDDSEIPFDSYQKGTVI